MASTLRLHVLRPGDWSLLKTARLAALHDSPHAFMSRYEVEWLWDEGHWRRSIETATWIAASDGEHVIGLARSVADHRSPRVRYVESIWVDPSQRRRGVFQSLIHALAEVEGHRGATELRLWVLEENHTARHAYQATGFTPTGRRQLLPELGRFELQLRREIRPGPGS